MALFKFRKGGAGDEPVAAAPQPESVEDMRRRARHRLIGASVLVLIGVIGFPLVFDTQPRPIAVDIPIEIPDRAKVKPLAPPPAAATSQAPTAAGVVTPAPAAATPPPVAAAATKADEKPAAAAPAPEPKPAEEPKVAKAEPKPEAKKADAAKPADGARAKALLEGKQAQSAAVEGRFVVQVGAFADASKARDTRLKVERAGLKTYTNIAETKDGKRIRVRVGPFHTRAEADKAAQKIKGLDLPAAILTL